MKKTTTTLVCNVCNHSKRADEVHENRKTGKLICENCRILSRYHDRSTFEVCKGCNRSRPVYARDESKNPICQTCSRSGQTCWKRKSGKSKIRKRGRIPLSRLLAMTGVK